MISFKEWQKVKETAAGAGGVYCPDAKIDGSWQGAPKGKAEPLSSVGEVKKQKKRQQKK